MIDFEKIDFEYSPNPVADQLEQLLGIEFSNKPKKIYLSVLNEKLCKYYLALPELENPNIAAFYSSKYNILFTRLFDEPYIDAHESMHGYFHQIRSNNLVESNNQVFEAFDIWSYSGKGNVIELAENILAYLCIEEGLADFTAWKYIQQSRNISPLTKRLYDLLLSNLGNPEKISTKISFYQTALNHFKQNLITQTLIHNYPNTSNTKKDLIRLQIRSYLNTFKQNIYNLGFVFSCEAMELLQNQGLSLPESLKALITHPPTRIDELLHPKEYLTAKIL